VLPAVVRPSVTKLGWPVRLRRAGAAGTRGRSHPSFPKLTRSPYRRLPQGDSSEAGRVLADGSRLKQHLVAVATRHEGPGHPKSNPHSRLAATRAASYGFAIRPGMYGPSLSALPLMCATGSASVFPKFDGVANVHTGKASGTREGASVRVARTLTVFGVSWG